MWVASQLEHSSVQVIFAIYSHYWSVEEETLLGLILVLLWMIQSVTDSGVQVSGSDSYFWLVNFVW